MDRYASSQPFIRTEDSRFLSGSGEFLDDLRPEGLVQGFMLRAPHGHARILSIGVSAARAAPGVMAVITGSDYRSAGWRPIPHIGPRLVRPGAADPFVPGFWPLAIDRVRMVGEGIAFVVAENLAQAKDAAELISVEYEVLPAVTDSLAALQEDAPVLWPEIGDNRAFVHEIGDQTATERAFAQADCVVTRRFDINRVLANSMETRGCVAIHETDQDHFTLYAPVQHPWVVRRVLAEQLLDIEASRIRVITPDVGGSFGNKANIYPEYLAALLATRITGRPVKWISERSEGFLSDFHGRDNRAEASLALGGDGSFLGFRLTNHVNIGAYLSPLGGGPAVNNLGTLSGVYTTPAAHVEVIGVYTNTHPTAPYRGAGRPEAAYIIECLVDAAARELDIDPIALRRRNMIPADALPYQTSLVFRYDSGDFARNLDDAVAMIGREGFDARRLEAKRAGRLRGLGIAYAIERAAPPGREAAEIRFDRDGAATILSGTTQQGQGHETMYSRLLCEWLGLAPDKVRVQQGDTGLLEFGQGSGGSRSSAMGSAALMLARDRILDQGRDIAANLIEAAVEDIEFRDGVFVVRGTDRSASLADVASAAFDPAAGPGSGLRAEAVYTADVPSYPNGCHACEVEIDPETGIVEIKTYVVVDDLGTVLNPLTVEGQIHGGVAQGAGQILLENAIYDTTGQLLTASFMDYSMPRAEDLSPIDVKTNPVPTATNPLGVKGVGEAGTVGAMPVVMNAVLDALAPLGIRDLEMPATPYRIWTAIRSARPVQHV